MFSHNDTFQITEEHWVMYFYLFSSSHGFRANAIYSRGKCTKIDSFQSFPRGSWRPRRGRWSDRVLLKTRGMLERSQ